MKIPLSWLKDYISIDLPPAQIGKLLTSAGLEVDAIESTGKGFEKVVVGLVKATQPHPNADKLCIATVTDGVETYQVVCAAPNCRAGIKTALALVGATLPDEGGKTFKVKAAKIRGVESFGMLCSSKELRLGDDQDGILEFAEQVKEGSDVAAMYGDSVFDIGLTPNLAYCNSVLGVARELSALTGLPVTHPRIAVQEDARHSCVKEVVITVKDQVKCPRYACRLIRDVRIGPSPEWLKKRLELCGMRSVNNVVDVTNYVLIEMGHPLHAFDFDLLSGHQIIVRDAVEGEEFMTLDNKKRILTKDDLLICDKNKATALAGVMGGLISEVSDNTKNILIESAYFQPASVRRTSKRLGLQTEGSKRFEKGCDPNNVLLALDRAAMLIQELASGQVAAGVVDIKESEFPEKQATCRLSRVNSLLGTHLSVSEVENIFHRLGFHCQWDGQKEAFEVKVPTYRVDVNGEIDLVEEVARLYGYDNIPKPLTHYHGSDLPHAPMFILERKVRSRLLAEGLQEFLTCDLIGPVSMNIVQDTMMPPESIVKVLNPTSIEQSVLRTSLLPGLLQVVKYNIDHQNHDINGFEIGRIHFKDKDQYIEQSVAGIIMTGKCRSHHWDSKPADVDFYDLKGILENVLNELGIFNLVFKPLDINIFHSGRQAAVYVDSLEIGSLGEIHPAIQRRLDVPQRILFAEFNLHDIFPFIKGEQKMRDIPIFPSSERDWTVTLQEGTPVDKVLSIIRAIPANLLESVSVVDLFRSEKLGRDKKNVTLHFVYRDLEKTIAQEAVEREHEKIVKEALNLLEKC